MRKLNFANGLMSLFIVLSLAFSLHAQNLLINPDAETGNTQGWVDPDDAWSAAHPIAPHGGDYFFWPARKAIPYTEMYQNVDMSSYAASIDAGDAWFDLNGWLANWDQYPHDRATLALEALNTNGEQLLYVSRDHRSPIWTFYQMEGQIPAGTRTLRVHLIATRFVGSDNDGYFDDLFLGVNTTAPSVYVTISAENNHTEIPVDSTLQLTAETIGATDNGYVWSSSFEAIATVDTLGLVTAHRAGKFTIQATGKNTGKTGFIELTAYNPEDIIFQSPRSETQWPAGSTQEITWEVKGTIHSAALYYSLTGGSDWTEIATIDSVESGHFFWTLPDTNATLNTCYLKMTWSGGEAVSSKFSIVPNVTAVHESVNGLLPSNCQLYANYPNPFNPSTTIRYRIGLNNGAAQHVSLIVYDGFGRVVRALVNETQRAGNYEVRFNAGNLASGVYFVRLRVGAFTQIRKMIYMR